MISGHGLALSGKNCLLHSWTLWKPGQARYIVCLFHFLIQITLYHHLHRPINRKTIVSVYLSSGAQKCIGWVHTPRLGIVHHMIPQYTVPHDALPHQNDPKYFMVIVPIRGGGGGVRLEFALQCIRKFHTMHCWRALTTTYTCLGASGFLSDTACLHVCMSECENGASATFGCETQTISLYQTVSLCCIPGTQWGKGYHTKGHTFAIFCIGRYIIEFTKKNFEIQSV